MPMQKSFVTSDGATLCYEDEGAGDVLILLHGWSQSAAMFRHQIAALSTQRRIIALDFRGHGRSPDADSGHRIYRFGQDLAELMDHASVESASVLGSSMGNSVLWSYIDLHGTGRINRLIFVDEPASVMRQVDMSDEEAIQAGALFDGTTMLAIAKQIIGPDGHATREGFLDSMIRKAMAPELRAWILRENLRAVPQHLASLFVNHCTIDWRDIFRRIDRPTLVIGGRVSHVDTRSQEWIHSQVSGSKLVIFEESEGGAHFPFLESPETFNPVIVRFLDGHYPPTPALRRSSNSTYVPSA
jgi:non-heme chloroperoxidase